MRSICLFIIMILLLISGCGTVDTVGEKKESEGNLVETELMIEQEKGQVQFELRLLNTTTETLELQFPSGQLFEIMVFDENGDNIYTYSEGKMFTQAVVFKQLEPSKRLVVKDTWENPSMLTGDFVAKATFMLTSINGVSVDDQAIQVEETFTIE